MTRACATCAARSTAWLQVGEEGQFTRRTARWSRMPDSCKPVLQRFVDQRLLVSASEENKEDPENKKPEPTLGVAHEALFRVWDTLNGWLREDRKALLLRSPDRGGGGRVGCRERGREIRATLSGPRSADPRCRAGDRRRAVFRLTTSRTGQPSTRSSGRRSRRTSKCCPPSTRPTMRRGQRPLRRRLAPAARPRGAGERRRAAGDPRRPAQGRRPS